MPKEGGGEGGYNAFGKVSAMHIKRSKIYL